MSEGIHGPWREATDPNTKKVYYYNTKTNETAWTKPREYGIDPNLLNDPSKWQVAFDPAQNKNYYVNIEANYTSWTKPDCVPESMQPKRPELPAPTNFRATPVDSKQVFLNSQPAPTAGQGPQKEKEKTGFRAHLRNASARMSAQFMNAVAKQPVVFTEMANEPESDDDDFLPPPDVFNDPFYVPPQPKQKQIAMPAAPKSKPRLNMPKLGKAGRGKNTRKLGQSQEGMEMVTVGDELDCPDAPQGLDPNAGIDMKQKEAAIDIYNRSHMVEEKKKPQRKEVEVNSDEEKWKEEFEDSDEEFTNIEFASHRVGFGSAIGLGREKTRSEMLQFQSEMITKSLLKVNVQLSDQASQIFKNIMSYMNDRKSSKTDATLHATKILLYQLNTTQQLRDECYLMLWKQTNGRPEKDITHIIQGWKLIILCLCTFPPSRGIAGFLIKYCKQASEHSSPIISHLAKLAQANIVKIFGLGVRHYIPGRREIEAVTMTSTIQMEIHFMDGIKRSYPIDSYTTVKVLLKQICKDRNILWKEGFGLYECASERPQVRDASHGGFIFEKYLELDVRVCDILSRWEHEEAEDLSELEQEDKVTRIQKKKHKGIKKEADDNKHDDFENFNLSTYRVKYNHIFFKMRLTTAPGHYKLKGDTVAQEYLFKQVRTNIICTAEYPLLEHADPNKNELARIPDMLAILLQEEFGPSEAKTPSGNQVKNLLEVRWPRVVRRKHGVDLDTEYAALVAEKWSKIATLSPLDCQLSFLELACQLQFFEAREFIVVNNQNTLWPGTLILSVTKHGIHLADPKQRSSPIRSWKYIQLVTWGGSSVKLILKVGTISSSRTLTFLTTQAKTISELLLDYVKLMLKKNTGK